MVDVIEQSLSELADLCRRFDVRQLELFGSAARGEFDPAKSDLDFLVAFRYDGKLDAAKRYLGLLMAMEDLFGRDVELVDVAAARNPYFMAEALKRRVTLYAA